MSVFLFCLVGYIATFYNNNSHVQEYKYTKQKIQHSKRKGEKTQTGYVIPCAVPAKEAGEQLSVKPSFIENWMISRTD